ncbi:Uncharacterised protein [Mycobacteroides abscessus]|nr:Uncharacterised protein [Mycobacteroides abscessus]
MKPAPPVTNSFTVISSGSVSGARPGVRPGVRSLVAYTPAHSRSSSLAWSSDVRVRGTSARVLCLPDLQRGREPRPAVLDPPRAPRRAPRVRVRDRLRQRRQQGRVARDPLPDRGRRRPCRRGGPLAELRSPDGGHRRSRRREGRRRDHHGQRHAGPSRGQLRAPGEVARGLRRRLRAAAQPQGQRVQEAHGERLLPVPPPRHRHRHPARHR